MKNLDTSSSTLSLACLEVGSIALGYRALSVMTEEDQVRVLDASPVGPRFMILVLGESKTLKDLVHRVRSQVESIESSLWIDSEIFEKISPTITDALFSLPQNQMEESLIVVETTSVSACLAAASTLVDEHGLKIIEVKILRSSTGGAYAYFTGPADKALPAAQDAQTRLKNNVREGRFEVVERASRTFKEFFNFNGSD